MISPAATTAEAATAAATTTLKEAASHPAPPPVETLSSPPPPPCDGGAAAALIGGSGGGGGGNVSVAMGVAAAHQEGERGEEVRPELKGGDGGPWGQGECVLFGTLNVFFCVTKATALGRSIIFSLLSYGRNGSGSSPQSDSGGELQK